jgi:hypothetical protein
MSNPALQARGLTKKHKIVVRKEKKGRVVVTEKWDVELLYMCWPDARSTVADRVKDSS